MVIITHHHFHPIFNNIDEWIEYGITSNAIWICGKQWEMEDWANRNYNRTCYLNVLKNKEFVEKFKPLNKW